MGHRPRILIVGAGIAGAATAWHLARRGVDVRLVDAASSPDSHASGRNAAILRSAIPRPRLHALAAESASFYRDPPPGFVSGPLVDDAGLVLAARCGGEDAALEAWLTDPACSREPEPIAAAELHAFHPFAVVEDLAAWRIPGDGVIDVSALHQAFLHGALDEGARLELRRRATEPLVEGGSLRGLRLDDGREEGADAVVLATGAWGDEILRPLGLERGLVPRRRHLFVTARHQAVQPDAPVLWVIGEQEYYLRPESGGLLLSVCDSEVAPPAEGERLDRRVRERAGELVLERLPGLADTVLRHGWSGMRTFAADGDFLLGPDPELPGLHWAAGLGGHGISTAYAVGRTVAEGVLAPATASAG